MSTARDILVRDPAMAILAQRAAEASTPHPPADRGPYPHGVECTHPDAPVPWELVDEEVALWRRQHVERGCGVSQYWQPTTPQRPPRPTVEELAVWDHSSTTTGEDGRPTTMRCPSVPPVVDITFEVDDRARGAGHWTATCMLCRSVKHWTAEASRHYQELGVEPSQDRPRFFSLDEL